MLRRLRSVQLRHPYQILRLLEFVEGNTACIPLIRVLELHEDFEEIHSNLVPLVVPLLYKLVNLRALVLMPLPTEICISVWYAVGRLPELKRLGIWVTTKENMGFGAFGRMKLFGLADLQRSSISILPKLTNLQLLNWNGTIRSNFQIKSSLRTLIISKSNCSDDQLRTMCKALPSSLRKLEIRDCSPLTVWGIHEALKCRRWNNLHDLLVHVRPSSDMFLVRDSEEDDLEDVFTNMPKLKSLQFSSNLFSPDEVACTSIKRLTIDSPTYSLARIIYLAHRMQLNLKVFTLRFRDEEIDRRDWVKLWPEIDEMATAVRAYANFITLPMLYCWYRLPWAQWALSSKW